MRAMEAVVGGLLLTSGLLGSVGFLPDGSLNPVESEGWAISQEIQHQGETVIEAFDAGYHERGEHNVSIQADTVTLRLYTHETNRVSTSVLGYQTTFNDEWRSTEKYTFEQADIHLSGDKTGSLYVWPTQAERGQFKLDLSDDTHHFFASKKGGSFNPMWSPHEYTLGAPVLGFSQGPSTFQNVQLESSQFEQFQARGSLQILANNATMQVHHSDGKETYTLHFEPGERQGVQAEGETEAGLAIGDEGTYAILELDAASGGSITSETESRDIFFLAQSSQMRLNGTTSFNAKQGQLSVDGTNAPLQDTEVEMVGNLSFGLQATGEDDLMAEAPVGWGLPASMLEAPKINAEFQGEADHINVDGEPISHPSPDLPEKATLLGKILGAILIAWSIGRRVLPFTLGLFTTNPLDHPRRAKILETLEELRIAHLRELHRRTSIPIGSLSYHLKVLERVGIVESVCYTNYRAYFLASEDLDDATKKQLAPLANETRRKIVQMILTTDFHGQNKLARELGLSQGAISKQLSKLLDAGVLEREDESTYRPSANLKGWIRRMANESS